MGYHDTDVAEYLFKGAINVDALSNFLCKDLTKVCSIKIPPLPKVKHLSTTFFQISADVSLKIMKFCITINRIENLEKHSHPSRPKMLRLKEL
jgi:hypothetical protein